jgi:hypothetical protein
MGVRVSDRAQFQPRDLLKIVWVECVPRDTVSDCARCDSMRRKRVLPVFAPVCEVRRQPYQMLVRSRRRTEEPQSLPRPAADAIGVHYAHHRCGLCAGRRITVPG